LGLCYIPPENSVKFSINIFDELGHEIAETKSKTNLPIVLIGDFNARTGTLPDSFHTSDPSVEEEYDLDYTLSDLALPTSRFNTDKYVNNSGRNLLDLCKCFNIRIINGRVGEDRCKAKMTCTT